MNDNKEFILKFGSSNNFVSASEQINILKEEHERLLKENAQLKKSIQNEEFLHSKVYKDWKELKKSKEAELTYNKVPHRRLSAAVVILVLLTLLGLATFPFYNYFLSQKSKSIAVFEASVPVVIDSLIPYEDKVSALRNSNVTFSNTSLKKKGSKIPQEKAVPQPDPALPSNAAASLGSQEDNAIQSSANTGLYKVKSTAYFYNDADSTTRRKAFIVHWNNRYATLKALDEKKGFVYVVFKNHLGQTSKGWLRKNDLYPVEEN